MTRQNRKWVPPEIRAAMEIWQGQDSEDNDARMQRMQRLRRNLKKAIDQELTGRQQTMLLMRYSENCSQTDMATRLGVDKSTVFRTLARARKKLARVLQYSL